MLLSTAVLVIASVTAVMAGQDSCAAGEEVAQDILERMENVEKKVAGLKQINDKIEQLSKITFDLSRNTGAASEKKMKMDIQ